MTATDLERKVRQLDNDVSEIYTMLFDISGTQKRHSNRFNELQADIASLDTRMGGLEGKMGGLDGRMSSLEGKMDGLEGQMSSLEGRVDSLEGKVDQVLDLLRDRPS